MIPIKNIYYMLSYVFEILTKKNYAKVGMESFDNSLELYSAILSQGIKNLVKSGLGRDYNIKTEILPAVKGKINLSQSIKTTEFIQKRLVCDFDEFSLNTEVNQIIKTTIVNLLKSNKLSGKRKKDLKKLLIYFENVQIVNLKKVNWNTRYNRLNQNYQMLIFICFMIYHDLLQTTEPGTFKIMEFKNSMALHKLYEKFLLAYFKKEFPSLTVQAAQIPWQLDDENRSMLPIMRSDITLSSKGTVLIIDAKFYSQINQYHFDKASIRSANLYQIFTYVKNMETKLQGNKHEVSGMLLYARTDESILPEQTYRMSGNTICIKTLDLNCDFKYIKEQLNSIIYQFFKIKPKTKKEEISKKAHKES